MKRILFPLLGLSLCLSHDATGAPNKSRDQQVIEDRKDMKDSDTWIYNDLESAKEAARSAGKPMFIVFRCIP